MHRGIIRNAITTTLALDSNTVYLFARLNQKPSHP
jgi:hypothetical protein